VHELNDRLGPWAFAIPEYKADVLARELEDLLKDLPEETAEDEAPAMSFEDLMPPDDGDEETIVEPVVDVPVLDEPGEEPASEEDDGLRRL